MPDDINMAYITPIFKGGNKSEPPNYRPVALTNHITKAFEKIIKQEILSYLINHQLLNITQHGFTTGRSTLTNQIEYYESILLLLEHHQYVDAIYLDYSKAFDKCDHNVILHKLKTLGIGGKIHNWITSFLKRRQQKVSVQGEKSEPVWCISGVPQGSVLGPLLFLILMIDITGRINHSILSSFADDTKVWKGISTTINEVHLQDDLDMLYIWAEQNNMEFNSKKFQAIRFAETLSHPYYNNDKAAPIEEHNLINDLGVHFSSDVKMDQHIHITANKGKKIAGWITRVFHNRTPGVMITLLKQLIYPTVEYNSVLWNPTDTNLINLLESVQNNFLKKVYSPTPTQNSDYWDRLSLYKLYSMQRRRERYSILYVWKIINNIYPNPGLSLNINTHDHRAHPNQGISIDAHPGLGITVHHSP